MQLFNVWVTEYGVRKWIQQQADSLRQAETKAGTLPGVSKVHGAMPAGGSGSSAT